jgi:cell division protein FtsN
MKKIILLGLCASVMVAFTSCRSSESAYKKAYEKAQQQAQAQKTAQETPVSGATAPVAVQPTTTNNDEAAANVRQEKVTVVSGDDMLKDYNVVAGSFGLKANAEGLKDYLVKQGYDSAAIAFNASNAMYRVIVATYPDYQSAKDARNSFKAKYPNRKDFQGAWLLYRVK